jgi:hypothetical protein
MKKKRSKTRVNSVESFYETRNRRMRAKAMHLSLTMNRKDLIVNNIAVTFGVKPRRVYEIIDMKKIILKSKKK